MHVSLSLYTPPLGFVPVFAGTCPVKCYATGDNVTTDIHSLQVRVGTLGQCLPASFLLFLLFFFFLLLLLIRVHRPQDICATRS